MWVAVFMVACVLPMVIWGCILLWQDKKAEKTT